MSVLLMRLAAPMQSWGAVSKFDTRTTEREPTKSGIIGLIACALGRKRNEDISDLQRLGFGVRVDREGELMRDYHTAKSQKSSYVTNRYYLSDAVFLVGLKGERDLLLKIDEAIRNPAFPLYLGRRSCPPEGRISLGLRTGKNLYEALRDEPWQSSLLWGDNQKERSLRVVLDKVGNEYLKSKGSYTLRDSPITYDFAHRQYGIRHIIDAPSVTTLVNPESKITNIMTTHDPIAELEE